MGRLRCPHIWESRGSSERKEPSSKASHTVRPERNRPVVIRPCSQKLGPGTEKVPARYGNRQSHGGNPWESLGWLIPGSPFLHSGSGLPPSCVLVPGPPIRCFSPSNFTIRQAAYVDSSCWDSLVHHDPDELGQHKMKSLWPHKVGGPRLHPAALGQGRAGQSPISVFSLAS